MAGEPNELPEGGEGGGGSFPWGGIRGEYPAELPVWDYRIDRASSALLREVLQLRGRIQQLENAQIASSVFGRSPVAMARFGVIGGPNELPEGGEGSGGGGIHIPFPGEIAELPIDTIFQRFSEILTQFAALEVRLVSALEGLDARLAERGATGKR